MLTNRIYINLSLIAVLFVVVTGLVQANLPFFEQSIGSSAYGPLLYVIIVVVAIVLAPVSTMPLVPVASLLWGPVVASFLNIGGWFLGSIIVFELCQWFGQDLIGKVVNLKALEVVARRISANYSWWNLIGLRLTLPVDVLSYALGLLTNISRKKYYISTIIGITPFAFVWSYVGVLPWPYQAGLLVIAGLFIVIGSKVGQDG